MSERGPMESAGAAAGTLAVGPTDIAAAPTFDEAAAVGFLRAQRAASAGCLGAVAAPAEPPHELWLSLIADARRRDCVAAEHLTALYACHGLVAGTVERRPHRLLPAEVAARSRSLLLHRLDVLTEQAVALLQQ